MSSESGKSAWYPGKRLGFKQTRNAPSAPTSSIPSNDKDSIFERNSGENIHNHDVEKKTTSGSSEWYLGKRLGRSRPGTSEAAKATTAKRPMNASDEVTSRFGYEVSPSDIVLLNDVTQSSTRRNVAIPNAHLLKPAGFISIRIFDARYLSFEKPSISITLEDQSIVNNKPFDSNNSSTASSQSPRKPQLSAQFSFFDICSDLVITISEDYAVLTTNRSRSPQSPLLVGGRIILPIAQYVGFSKALQPKFEWRQIFPLYKNQESNHHFRSGYDEIADFAMTRPKQSLGFLSIEVEVCLQSPAWQLYWQPRPLLSTTAADSASACKVLESETQDLAAARLRNQLKRWKEILKLPPLIAPMFCFPEIILLCAVLHFLCLSVTVWQLPLVCAIVIAINGVLAKTSRSFSDCIVWNDPIKIMRLNLISAGSIAPQPGSSLSQLAIAANAPQRMSAVDSALLLAVQTMHADSAALLPLAEKWINLWNWSDRRVSLIAYCFLCVATFSLSLQLLILPARWIASFWISVLLIASSMREMIVDAADELLSLPSDAKSEGNNVDSKVSADATLSVTVDSSTNNVDEAKPSDAIAGETGRRSSSNSDESDIRCDDSRDASEADEEHNASLSRAVNSDDEGDLVASSPPTSSLSPNAKPTISSSAWPTQSQSQPLRQRSELSAIANQTTTGSKSDNTNTNTNNNSSRCSSNGDDTSTSLLQLAATRSNINETNNRSISIGRRIHFILAAIESFWSRIPDEAEMVHRHICSLSLVKESGAEMLDASIAWKPAESQ